MSEQAFQRPGISVWFQELRAPFFTAAIAPSFIGAAAAWAMTGSFNLLYFILVTAGVIFLHGGTNVVNDYFDYKSGNDMINKNKSMFNGGSPFLVDGTFTPRQVYAYAILLFALGSIIGVYLWLQTSWEVLVLGIIGVGAGYFYTSPRIYLARHGIGEFFIGLCFGQLIVMGAYFVQTGFFDMTSVFAGLPMAFLIAQVVFINQFPDYEADKTVGKTHWVVRMGRKKSVKYYIGMFACTFVSIIAGVVLGYLPIIALIALVPMVIAMKAVGITKAHYDEPKKLVPAQGMTIMIHLLVGILLTVAFVLDGFLNLPWLTFF